MGFDSNHHENLLSTLNSTSAPLTSSSVYTGTFEECLDYATITVIVFANVASATSGFEIQWSSDGSNIDDSDGYTIQAATGKQYSFGVMARYFRIKYTNGGTNQSAFRLQTILHSSHIKPSSHRIDDTVVADDDAELSKTVITGKRLDGTYGTASFDDSNRLIVTDPAAAASGGFNYGIVATSGTTEVSVRKTTYTEQSSDAQRSIVSSSVLDTSAGTGIRTVKITYYTAAGAGPFTETITLNGITAVNTAASNICFVEKLEATTVGSLSFAGGTISLKAATAGLGVTIGSIAASDTQTFWAHHYVPTGYTAYITGVSLSNDKSSIDSGAVFRLRSLPIGVSNAIEDQITEHLRYFAQDSTYTRTYQSPVVVAGPARIVAYVVPDNGTTMNNRCAFDFYEQET